MKNDYSWPRVAAGTRRRFRASAPVLVALALLLGLPGVRPAAALDAARPVEDLLERRWTTAPGLPQNGILSLALIDDSKGPGERLVRCLLVDGRGRLWVGTEGGGLFRGDGVSFERLGLDLITTVNALTEDTDGNVWLAADQNLLARIVSRIGWSRARWQT
jgi:hypothetical protein